MDGKYQVVTSFDNIYKAFGPSRRGSYWKDSIIGYDVNRLERSIEISRALRSGKYKLKGHYHFKIQEREKIRDIQSLHIRDRVDLQSLCDKLVTEDTSRSFIYDNGASLKGKGTNFSRNRLKTHMRRFYNKHGLNGYVLQIDVKKYFDNIPHWYLKERMIKRYEGFPDMQKCLCDVIDSFDGNKGLGPGSQAVQIFALETLDKMDHFIKEALGIKYYGRYMDDAYLIHEDKDYLKHCKEILDCFLNEIELTLHPNKTNLYPLKRGIKFLGFKFNITETGHIYVKLNKDSVKRIKRKLRNMARLGLPEETIQKTFTSWKNHANYGNSYYTVKNVGEYLDNLLTERRKTMGEQEERYAYAELNEDSVCINIIETAVRPEEVPPNFVQIEKMDETYLMATYIEEMQHWIFPEEPESEPQPTQLDRVEQALFAKNDALRQEGADEITQELIERGIL